MLIGLDSAISYEVMAAVRNLANQNRTVICTIHQPSPPTYLLFDKLMLLAEGRVIYFGPSRDVVNYFVTSPYKFHYKPGSNPADFVVAVGGSFINSHEGHRISGQELAALYAKSELCRVFLENIDTTIAMDLAAGATTPPADHSLSVDTKYPTPTLNQVKVLCHRVIVRTIKERRPAVVTFVR